jgi:hypothetical protein
MSGARFDRMAPWQGATNCTGGPTDGAEALLAYWLEAYRPPGSSMGIYNCRTVRGGSTTSLHGEGRAVDLGVPVTAAGHAAMWRFLRNLAPHAYRLGIQLVIFDRTIWSARRRADGDRYGGVHPHRDHAHVELTWKSARTLNLATLRAVLGTATEEDDVYVVKHGDQGERVARAQTILQAAGRTLNLELLPKHGTDGGYGPETAAAVDTIAKRAKLPAAGDTGMDVLVLDYARMLLEADRRDASGGISRGDADARYARRGATITLP